MHKKYNITYFECNRYITSCTSMFKYMEGECIPSPPQKSNRWCYTAFRLLGEELELMSKQIPLYVS